MIYKEIYQLVLYIGRKLFDLESSFSYRVEQAIVNKILPVELIFII